MHNVTGLNSWVAMDGSSRVPEEKTNDCRGALCSRSYARHVSRGSFCFRANPHTSVNEPQSDECWRYAADRVLIGKSRRVAAKLKYFVARVRVFQVADKKATYGRSKWMGNSARTNVVWGGVHVYFARQPIRREGRRQGQQLDLDVLTYSPYSSSRGAQVCQVEKCGNRPVLFLEPYSRKMYVEQRKLNQRHKSPCQPHSLSKPDSSLEATDM